MMKSSRRFAAVSLAALALLTPLQSPSWGQVEITTVIESSRVSAGGTVRAVLEVPTVGGAGSIFFKGNFQNTPANSSQQFALLYDSVPFVREQMTSLAGDLAPGSAGRFYNLHRPIGNAQGAVAFTAQVDASDGGIWTGNPSAGTPLQLVALSGTQAPGTSVNFTIDYLSALVAFNDAGQVLFRSHLGSSNPDSGTGNSTGYWLGSPGNVQLLVRGNDPAPGFPAGYRFTNSFQFVDAALNAEGETIFVSNVRQGTEQTLGLFFGQPGALQLVAKKGDPLPGTDGEYAIDTPDHPTLNAAGEIAFTTSLTRLVPTPVDEGYALVAGTPGSLHTVLRTGDLAPGFGAGERIDHFHSVALDAEGNLGVIAYVSVAAGVQEMAVYFGRAGQLRLIARQGNPAVGLNGFEYALFSGLAMSGSGQVAFTAITTNNNGNNPPAFFATDKTGTLRLVKDASTGYEPGPDSGLGRAIGDGRRVSFNAAGQLFFSYTINDQDGSQDVIYRASFSEAPPVILPLGQPQPVRATLGQDATLSVVAHGTHPLSYQWQKNGEDIAGATGPVLKLAAVNGSDRGTYTVQVTNSISQTVSAGAALGFPPEITVQPPLRLSAASGATTSLAVTAQGQGTLSYQWQRRAVDETTFADVPGGTAATLTLASLSAAQAGIYRVVVSNADGSTTSGETVFTVAAPGQPVTEAVLLTGERHRQYGTEYFYSSIQGTVTNSSGALSFRARLTDAQGNELGDVGYGATSGHFYGQPGAFRFMGTPGNNPGFMPNLSDSGDSVIPSTGFFNGGYYGRPDLLEILYARGSAGPVSGTTIGNQGNITINTNGDAAFTAGDGTAGVIFGRPGALQSLALPGQQAAGFATGVTYDQFNNVRLPINNGRTVVVGGTVEGPGITNQNNTAIWFFHPNNSPQRILAEGEPAPGIAGGRFGDCLNNGAGNVGLNVVGQIVAVTDLAGVNSGYRALFAGAPGNLQIVARSEQPAGSGFTFSDLANEGSSLINANGQVLFYATVLPTSGPVKQSLWRWTPPASGSGAGTRLLIAREGQQAPGCPAGVVFQKGSDGSYAFGAASINAAGQVFFYGRLAGTGVTASNDEGLWLTDAAGAPRLLARKGEAFDVGGGQLRTPIRTDLGSGNYFGGSGGQDGLPRVLTDDGRVIFALRFASPPGTDDTGIFRATVSAGSTNPGANDPIPTTGAATNVTQSGAKLNGTVDPNGTATTAHFEYGTGTSYGQTTVSFSIPASNNASAISATITGLQANTLYHYRLVAGGIQGADATFTTLDAGTPDPAAGSFGFALEASSTAEGARGYDIVVTRTGGKTGAVEVPIAIGGSAVAGEDYSAAVGAVLNFKNKQTSAKIRFTALYDLDPSELDETVTLTLGTPTNGGTLGSVPVHTVTIANSIPTSPLLSVAIDGPAGAGKVAGAPLGVSKRGVNGRVSLSATPNAGFMFAGWSGDVSQAQPRLTVLMNGDKALTANFVVSPFDTTAGVYSGLAEGTSPEIDAALVSLKVERTGLFTATISSPRVVRSLAPSLTTLKVKSSFDHTGHFQRDGNANPGPYAIEFQHNPVGSTITATLTLNGQTVTGTLQRANYNQANPPPFVGQYTLALVPDPADTTAPRGYGYATVSVSALGTVKAAGMLADGTKLSTGGILTGERDVALFSRLNKSTGQFTAALTIDPKLNPAQSDIEGTIFWYRSFGPASKPYPTGFSTELTALASLFTRPSAENNVFNAPVFSGSLDTQLAAPGSPVVPHPVTLDAKSKLTFIGTDTLTGAIDEKTGVFKGTFKGSTGFTKAVPLTGVVLQKQQTAAGYFLLENESGSFLLHD